MTAKSKSRVSTFNLNATLRLSDKGPVTDTLMADFWSFYADAFEHLLKIPGRRSQATKGIPEQSRELARKKRVAQATSAIIAGLETLREAANGGDLKAAKGLVQCGTVAIACLKLAEDKQPDMMREVAHDFTAWPRLVGEVGDRPEQGGRPLVPPELGATHRWFKTHFRRANESTANARKWAKAAVRILDASRFRVVMFGVLADRFGSVEALQDWGFSHGWRFATPPAWIHEAVSLPPLSKATLPAWATVIRAMIREQAPDFHTHDDWKTQREAAKANARGTLGVFQNRILDDIYDAVKTLAPG